MDLRIYAPAAGLQTWRNGLADPETQWVRTKSAFETAVFWEVGARGPRGLHSRLIDLLDQEDLLKQSELVASFPEHRVRLPGGSTASQSDVWAILSTPRGLVSVAVEGKAGETFGGTVGEWRTAPSEGKMKRLAFLCEHLGLADGVSDSIRYQLLHRTVSAILEADRIGAIAAAVIVLSFTEDAKSKDDFCAFGTCLRTDVVAGRLCRATAPSRRPLFLGWLDVPPCTDADIAAVAV